MPDVLQLAQQRAERVARNMIYPGSHLSQSYYEDKDLGKIYVAIGKGEIRVNQFGHETEEPQSTIVKDVWRGIWFVQMGEQCFGQKVNCLAGDLSEEDAIQDVIRNAKDPSARLKKHGAFQESYWRGFRR